MIYDNETLRQNLINYTSRGLVPLICSFCSKEFSRRKNDIQWSIAKNPTGTITCSPYCGTQLKTLTNVIKSCVNCGKLVKRQASEAVGNSFCSSSCAAKYNNAHKSVGTRRSKLEVWLEQQLPQLYPKLTIQFNMKDTINSELDIYIPSLKLAFELNGIFHYEPIYGQEKLKSILNNDSRKFQACLELDIELCIIDTSMQKHFTEKSSGQFLIIIQNIINQKLTAMQRVSDLN